MSDYSDFDIAQPSDIQNLLRKKYNLLESSKFLKVDNIIRTDVLFELNHDESGYELRTLLKVGDELLKVEDEFIMLGGVGGYVVFYVVPKHASIQTIWKDTTNQSVQHFDIPNLASKLNLTNQDVYLDANSPSIYHISYHVTKSGETIYMSTNDCYRVLIRMKLNNSIRISDLFKVKVGSDGKVKFEDGTNVEDGIFYVVPKYAKLVTEMMSGIKLVNKDGLVTSLKDDMMVGYFNANPSYPDPSKTPTDFYKTLEVNQDATSDQIKNAYRTLSFQRHPDKPGGSTDAIISLVKYYK
jgi:hypothetical protein